MATPATADTAAPRVAGARLAQELGFPVLVVALVAWSLVGSDPAWASRLGLPAVATRVLVFGVTYAVGFSVLFALERWLPYQADWQRARGDVRTDAAHFVLTGSIANVLFQLTFATLFTSSAAWLAHRAGGGVWPSRWPLVPQLVLALVLADLGHYWIHRLAHEAPLLWRLHATHHSPTRLYWFNASRFHPLDLFAIFTVEFAPLLMLGIGERALVAFLLFRSLYGQIQHCNIAFRIPGALNWLFSSHELHRWHHAPNPREGNTNYGAVVSCWDLLFGTYFRPRDRRFDGVVGLDGLPSFPATYIGQLSSPLQWRKAQRARRG